MLLQIKNFIDHLHHKYTQKAFYIHPKLEIPFRNQIIKTHFVVPCFITMHLIPVFRVPKYWPNVLPPSTKFKSENGGTAFPHFHHPKN